MADVPVDKLKEQLKCSVCLETYNDPKILECFHIFCQKCLDRIYQKHAIPGFLSCPNCRQVTPIAKLHPAFHINSLLEIVNQHTANPMCPSAGEVVEYRKFCDPPSSSIICCSDHDGRVAELYCETCKKMICLRCVIRGAQHNSHDYKDIDESFEKYVEDITPFLEPMEKKMLAVNSVLSSLSDFHEKIAQEHKVIKSDIRENMKQMHDLIDQREKDLFRELNDIITMKLKGISLQKHEMGIFQAQLSSCLEFTKLKVLDSGHSKVMKSEAVAMKTDLLKQIKKVLDKPEPKVFTPSTETSAVFSIKEDMPENISSYGKVSGTSPDPSKCTIAGNGSQQALVNETATAILTAVNFKDERCILPLTFELELVSELTGRVTAVNIEPIVRDDRDRSEYAVTYQPTSKGRHMLHIKADGQHIKGSPFSIAVKMPVERLGPSQHALNDIVEPWGVTLNRRGEIVVTEWGNSCVSIFSPMGKKLQSFKARGHGDGVPGRLCNVAVDSEGNVFATCENHCIQKFTSDGYFSKSVGTRGKELLEFDHPYGITYNSYSKKVYVADRNNHRIQVLWPDLNFSKMFGKKGGGKGQFDYPQGMATDSTGKVYVADTGNHRIQVFTENGIYVTSLGKKGTGRGKLDMPCDVAVDENGMVYVSDFKNSRISVFSPEGECRVSFGGRGTGMGQFDSPRGLAVDSSRVVYVCDSSNNRVQLF